MIKFNHYYNRPEPNPEAPHSHTYTWSYLDINTGDIVTDTVDQVAKTNSINVLSPADLIMQGLGGNPDNGIYGDITDIPADFNSMLDYISGLQAALDAYKAEKPGETSNKTTEPPEKTTGTDTKNNAEGVRKDEKEI